MKLTIPLEGEKNRLMIPTRTTVEMKCGAYTTVCTIFLYRRNGAWFSSSASRIGTGKEHSSVPMLTDSVLVSSCIKSVAEKNRSKFLSPTQALPVMPFVAL